MHILQPWVCCQHGQELLENLIRLQLRSAGRITDQRKRKVAIVRPVAIHKSDCSIVVNGHAVHSAESFSAVVSSMNNASVNKLFKPCVTSATWQHEHVLKFQR